MAPSIYDELARRLRRTDLLILRAVRRQRARPNVQAKGQFWGSVITDDDVDELLRNHGEIDYPEGVDELDASLRFSETLRDDPDGRIGRIATAFHLSGDDVDILLLALAPEVSAGYNRLYAYLQDNLSTSYLTVDLATRVIRTRRAERLALQARLLPGAPLIRNRLLLLHPPDAQENHTLKRLQPSPRLTSWLLEGQDVPPSLGVKELDTRVQPFVPSGAAERVDGLGDGLDRPCNYLVVGASRGVREAVAQLVARRCGRPLWRIDLDRTVTYREQPYELVRDLRLAGSIPLLTGIIEAQEDPVERTRVLGLGAALATLDWPVLVSAADRRAVTSLLGDSRPSVTLLCGRSTLEERKTAWSAEMTQRGWTTDQAAPLAERFNGVGGTTIHAVLERAAAEAGGRQPDDEQLWMAARDGSRPEFRGLAQHVVPRYGWHDLVLPERILTQLGHIVDYLAHQETVFHRWGASKVRARGFGIKALFSGGPGTGKTMAAEVIAGSLGLDLFRVDLSQVISRWVGETEKNLKEIFDAAEGGTAVILFDEADALFGSRGEVKQAQDRFANQEVSFLLQRLETFEGCAILTTNLQENIDDAFQRRFGSVIEFPMPSTDQRRVLWDRAFAEDVPKATDLDLDYLAKQFNLAGGSIVNAAIQACVLAAADTGNVEMRHAIRAVGKELVKMNKQVNRVHFGDYFDLVADL